MIPIDSGLHDPIGSLKKVGAVRLDMKPDEIGSQEPIHQFALPWTNPKRFLIGPWNVPENRYPGVRPFLFYHSGQQREMIILHQNDRLLTIFHFFQEGVSKLAIHRLILLPVARPKNRTRVRDVTERPQPLIGEAGVTSFLFFFREPDAAQRISRL